MPIDQAAKQRAYQNGQRAGQLSADATAQMQASSQGAASSFNKNSKALGGASFGSFPSKRTPFSFGGGGGDDGGGFSSRTTGIMGDRSGSGGGGYGGETMAQNATFADASGYDPNMSLALRGQLQQIDMQLKGGMLNPAEAARAKSALMGTSNNIKWTGGPAQPNKPGQKLMTQGPASKPTPFNIKQNVAGVV